MSTDGPTEKIPTTAAAQAAHDTPAEPAPATAAYPTRPADPLTGFDEPASPAGTTPAPEAGPAVPAPERRGVRVGTFVWGLVIAAVGVGVLALSAGYTLDVELALIVLLGVAGAAMLVGSLLKGRRRG